MVDSSTAAYPAGRLYCICQRPYEADNETDDMVGCESCDQWYHLGCIKMSRVELQNDQKVTTFLCRACSRTGKDELVDAKQEDSHQHECRRSSRKRARVNYRAMDGGLSVGETKGSEGYRTFLRRRGGFEKDSFRRLPGEAVRIALAVDGGLRDPFVVERPDGLGMRLPPDDLDVRKVVELVGSDRSVDVLDVATQTQIVPAWSLRQWGDYYDTKPEDRTRILNVISLEVSHTPIAELVQPPEIVREIGWVETLWPKKEVDTDLRQLKTNPSYLPRYPKVQLYTLMSVAGAFTDFHIDFGGSSVWYHVARGVKRFYFIRPTPANLKAYERWSTDPSQNAVFLADHVDCCTQVDLHAGNTLCIPTGWIHAVFTPIDSLVFGGNFLHNYNLKLQLEIHALELRTAVPSKYHFPLYSESCWYAAERLVDRYQDRKRQAQNRLSTGEFCKAELSGAFALLKTLRSKVRKGDMRLAKAPKGMVPKRIEEVLNGLEDLRRLAGYRDEAGSR